MKRITIAIDGPSGAGKSSMSNRLAELLGIMHLDTGAMYRALAVECMNRKLDAEDEKAITDLLPQLEMEVRFHEGKQQTYINGQDLTPFLYRHDVSMAASTISKISAVRRWLVARQQKLAVKESFILDGRDIGTVVLPHADIKFFLTADAETRAQRRLLDLQGDGQPISFAEVLADIIRRDEQDQNRANSPLRMADDAILIDSAQMSREEVVEQMLMKLRERGLIGE